MVKKVVPTIIMALLCSCASPPFYKENEEGRQAALKLATDDEAEIYRRWGDLAAAVNVDRKIVKLKPVTGNEYQKMLDKKMNLQSQARPGPGMCAGSRRAGHHLVNRSSDVVVYLEIGDRTAVDSVFYPDDDIEAYLVDGTWHFRHRNGKFRCQPCNAGHFQSECVLHRASWQIQAAVTVFI